MAMQSRHLTNSKRELVNRNIKVMNIILRCGRIDSMIVLENYESLENVGILSDLEIFSWYYCESHMQIHIFLNTVKRTFS